MTLILLGPVSLQFNIADPSKQIKKSRKKGQKYFLDGEMVKILRYLNFAHVGIKN
jgi:hypothetical protein